MCRTEFQIFISALVAIGTVTTGIIIVLGVDNRETIKDTYLCSTLTGYNYCERCDRVQTTNASVLDYLVTSGVTNATEAFGSSPSTATDFMWFLDTICGVNQTAESASACCCGTGPTVTTNLLCPQFGIVISGKMWAGFLLAFFGGTGAFVVAAVYLFVRFGCLEIKATTLDVITTLQELADGNLRR